MGSRAWPPQWFALAAAVTVLNGATLGYLAWRERHRGLWFWAVGWLAWGRRRRAHVTLLHHARASRCWRWR